MSCAAAAETLLAALRAFGLTGTLMPQPLPPVPDVIARVTLLPEPASGGIDHADARRHRHAPHGAPRLRRDGGAGRGADADARDGAPVRRRAQPVRGCRHARRRRRACRRRRPHPVRRPGVSRRARLLDAPADLAGRRRPRRPRLRLSRLGDPRRRRRCCAPSISAAPSPAWTSRTCSARRCSASSPPAATRAASGSPPAARSPRCCITLTMHGLVNAFLNQPIEVTGIRPKLAAAGRPRAARRSCSAASAI